MPSACEYGVPDHLFCVKSQLLNTFVIGLNRKCRLNSLPLSLKICGVLGKINPTISDNRWYYSQSVRLLVLYGAMGVCVCV